MSPSPNMMEEEASRSLHQVWFVIKEQRLVLAAGAVFGILLAIGLFIVQPAIYESRGQFIIDELPFRLTTAKTTDGSVSQTLVQSLIKSIPSTEMQVYVANQLHVPEKDVIFSDLSPNLSLRKDRQANISVENPRDSRIGQIIADSSNPEFAADVVNTIMEQFQELNYIAGRFQDLELKINYSQDKITKLGDQLVTASGERIRFERQKLALDSHLSRGQSIENFPVFEGDITLNNLKTRYLLVKSELESLSSYSVRGPKLEGAQAEVQDLEMQIHKYAEGLGAALRASYEIAMNQEKDLQEAVTNEQKQVNEWERVRSSYVQAIGDLKLRRTLNFVNGDRTELKQASVVVVMEKAQPNKRRKSPRGSICLAIGLTIGLGLGLSAAFILHTLDRRVKLPTQIETLTDVRCLAVLASGPETNEKGPRISKVPRGLYFLRSQLLRAAITGNNDRIFSFSGLNDEADVIKTVAQLAILLAETEKKTLVVDLFFNSAQMCRELGIEPKGSLNQWLSSDEEMSKFINVTTIRELAVLDSQKSMDVAEDLISRRPLIPSLEKMKSEWDFILIAAPPLLEVSYLLFAAPLGSPVIGVAEYQKSSLDDVQELHDRCKDEGLKFTGIVINNYPLENILGKELVFGLGGHRYLFENGESPRELT